ncbi:MAG: type II secretion system protein [Cyanobacteria bacterium P01_A01_bin.116]
MGWRQNRVKRMEMSLPRQPKSIAGLTLIECLVAIAVMGFTAAAIGPMMIFSVATRVQNQRAEQALQLAQAEVDRVRLVVELGGEYKNKLDALPLPSTTTTSEVRLVAPPAQFFSTAGSVSLPTHARTLDTDNDGDEDYAIQLFRTEGVSVGSTPIVFDVGVRVYDARRSEPNLGSLTAEPAGLKFTSSEGQGGTRPLAVLYTQIAQGDRDGSLCQHWELLSSAGTVPSGLICD